MKSNIDRCDSDLGAEIDYSPGSLSSTNLKPSALERAISKGIRRIGKKGLLYGLAGAIALGAAGGCLSHEQRLAKRIANEQKFREKNCVIARPGHVTGANMTNSLRRSLEKNYYKVWDKHGLVYYVPKEGVMDLNLFVINVMDRIVANLPGYTGGNTDYPIVIPEKNLIIFPEGYIKKKRNWKLDDD